MLEGCLSLPALGDVAHADDEAQRLLAHLGDGHFDGKYAFVLSATSGLVRSEPEFGLCEQLPKTARGTTVQHRYQLAQVAADDFRCLVPEDLLTGRVTGLNHSAFVDGQNAFGDVVEYRPQVGFALSQGSFGDAALFDLA